MAAIKVVCSFQNGTEKVLIALKTFKVCSLLKVIGPNYSLLYNGVVVKAESTFASCGVKNGDVIKAVALKSEESK